jgi:hypothetical protein
MGGRCGWHTTPKHALTAEIGVMEAKFIHKSGSMCAAL